MHNFTRFFLLLAVTASIFLMLQKDVLENKVGIKFGDESNKAFLAVSKTATRDPGETVKKAMEDNAWIYAKSREEVNLLLSEYYCGEYLQNITEDVWDYIKNPTDMYIIVRVMEIKVMYIDNERAVLNASICAVDAVSGETELGRAVFTLKNMEASWKIVQASYQWQGIA